MFFLYGSFEFLFMSWHSSNQVACSTGPFLYLNMTDRAASPRRVGRHHHQILCGWGWGSDLLSLMHQGSCHGGKMPQHRMLD